MLYRGKGNMFDNPHDTWINTVNCVGVMGKGLAKQFADRYPNMLVEYKHECATGNVRIGYPHVYHSPGVAIINLPTKEHWRDPSKYEWIRDGLIWLRGYLYNSRTSSVALPALGCGNGGLDWAVVSEMIREHLGGIKTPVYVYAPNPAT